MFIKPTTFLPTKELPIAFGVSYRVPAVNKVNHNTDCMYVGLIYK